MLCYPPSKGQAELLAVVLLDVVDEGLIHQMRASRCRIITTEVPVTRVIGNSLVQPLHTLEDQLYLGIRVNRTQ